MLDMKEESSNIAGFSFKTFLITVLGILLFGIYLSVLMYGENSLTVLNQLKIQKKMLIEEQKTLRVTNQQLQKAYFELKQLEP